ncbi:HD domain-containing protein [Sphingomonas edaphi]|uniref:HD domain-containing protein n=1 Tax=Sphingomonas edaphi TaxID=2315689 RepID=A0A418PXT7_9SPHN|nr:HD domain-containing protein [Sphingomonas edaphi]RIX26809.1 HD domain-containing protein [Sphingomonas edaphi]
MNSDAPRATFRSMEESTAQDWAAIGQQFAPFAANLPDRVLAHLKLLDGDYGGFPIDRLQHSLQTATRAHRAGEGETYVVAALLHDIGDTLGSYNHPDIAAAILKPFVDEKTHWIVEHHGIFQGYYFFHYLGMNRDMREAFRGHKHFEDTTRFCELYDQAAFDASYDSAPLEFFEPMVRRVLSRPINTVYKAVGEAA